MFLLSDEDDGFAGQAKWHSATNIDNNKVYVRCEEIRACAEENSSLLKKLSNVLEESLTERRNMRYEIQITKNLYL
jgi:hypothetical protein